MSTPTVLEPDTVPAVVVYGDHRLLDTDGVPEPGEVQAVIDSLERLPAPPAELLDHLRALERLCRMRPNELEVVIDSLFGSDDVPYALINEVSRMMARAHTAPIDDAVVDWYGGHPIPATHVYGEWITDSPNAYSMEPPMGDSLVFLRLVRPELACGAHLAVRGPVTSRFGRRHGRPHNGIDIASRTGEPVHCMFPGVVRYAGSYGSYGRIVVVRHWNGLETFYAHLHRVRVQVGQELDPGDVIGLAGSTGRSTGPHLHLEVRFKGQPIDPCVFMDPTTGEVKHDILALRRTRWGYAALPPESPPIANDHRTEKAHSH